MIADAIDRTASKEGSKVPSVTFHTRVGDAWVDVTSDSVFSGKNVIVFSLPGAFTPTCSSTHLPRYNQLANLFKEQGVDEIVCISVNDTFVMNAWLEDQEAENVRLLPDGNGEFTEQMGMLVDKRDLGFGARSWRYSMYVSDGVIQKMFIEPDLPGDPFEVSDADTMLKYLAPDVVVQEPVTIFTKPGCPHCERAKAMLREHAQPYEEVVVGKDVTLAGLRSIVGDDTAPQIFKGGQYLGTEEELEKFYA
jgi:glutaredoxin-like protein